jgi:hypothetical protein
MEGVLECCLFGVLFVSWDRPFDQPVPLPGERPARTLRDAANYIRKLPEPQRDTPEWRLAVQMLLDAAEDCGPMLFAKIGIERAISSHIESGQPLAHRWSIRGAAS